MYPSALEMLEEAQEGSAKGDDVSKCVRDAGGNVRREVGVGGVVPVVNADVEVQQLATTFVVGLVQNRCYVLYFK